MPSQNPGIFRRLAEKQNVEFHEIDLHAGEPIPDIIDFDGLWIMGGSMDVWEEDEFPWLIEEKQVIRQVVETLKMPFFGICLGHQLLADALGGKVEKNRKHEIGLVDVEATEAGFDHPLLAKLPTPAKWVNVHTSEVTRAPPKAIILASSKACNNHAMQVGANAYSCQFHPEVCENTVEDWMLIKGIPEALESLIGIDGLSNFKARIANYLPEHNAAATQLFENWLNLVFRQTRTPA